MLTRAHAAGGYDAIWVLAFDPAGGAEAEQPAARVAALWAGWRELRVSPLRAAESAAGGARVEGLADVPGLAELVAG